ncbi:periplasmic heavy metal sensor [Hansschlegelia quercus]|nr:periplasmic heavy metal sensor [Hansschlegelia quercus]
MALRRPRALVYGLLAASLAINLIGAGYFGFVGFRPKPPRTAESTIDFVTRRFPAPVAEAVRAKLEERRDELREAMKEMRAARRETRDAMSDAPFDADRADKAFADARAKSSDFQKVIHSAIISALPGVPEADRAKIDRNDD